MFRLVNRFMIVAYIPNYRFVLNDGAGVVARLAAPVVALQVIRNLHLGEVYIRLDHEW